MHKGYGKAYNFLNSQLCLIIELPYNITHTSNVKEHIAKTKHK